jgi:assimilatory nitrate reductase catalytic subunit
MKVPQTTAEAFEEMRVLSKGRLCDISGMTHARIKAEKGIQWPCPDGATTGAPRLYTDGHFRYADRKAKLITLPFEDNNERPDEAYPFWLNSGRVVEHFHTRTKTGKIGNLNKFSPTPYMEINPDAAQALGVEHMQYVRLVSRRGDAVVMAQLTHRVPRDMVFIPFHFHDCVNRLSLGLLDPYSRQPAFKQCAVRIEPVAQATAGRLNAAMRRF